MLVQRKTPEPVGQPGFRSSTAAIGLVAMAAARERARSRTGRRNRLSQVLAVSCAPVEKTPGTAPRLTGLPPQGRTYNRLSPSLGRNLHNVRGLTSS